MNSGRLIEALQHVVDILDELGEPYALGGGLAYSVLVEPRATIDIDIFILITPEISAHLTRRLQLRYEAVIPRTGLLRVGTVSLQRIVVIKNHRELIIDLVSTDPAFMKSMTARAQPVTAFGRTIPLLTLEDLYILKTRSSRAQDRADLENLTALHDDGLDMEYITTWLEQLS